MANYAQSLYGAAIYGPSATAADQVTGLTATVLNYGSISLSWGNPGSQWIRMRLVRSQYGFPITQDDGIVLFEVNAGPAASAPVDASVTSYTDMMLATPRFYYYSIFISKIVGATTQWVRSGTVIGQSVKDHGYTPYLLNRLPGVFATDDGVTEEIVGNHSTPLSRFLSITAMEISRARDNYDHLTGAWDPERIHANLLPELLGTYNFPLEPNIGIRNNRALTAAAPFITRMKGTAASAVALGEAVTGYRVKVVPFTNLMFDDNDSSFEQSLGHWSSTGSATIARSTTVTRNDGTNPAAGSMQVTATANGNIDLASADSGYGFGSNTYGGGQYGVGSALVAIGLGIPVSVGKQYTISAYVASAGNTTQPICDIQWFDVNGAFISTSPGVTGLITDPGLTARMTTTATAPGGALFAIPHIRLVGVSNGDIFYVDQVQFEQAASASPYSPARQVILRLVAPRINEMQNPGFDTDVSNWSGLNATLSWDGTFTFNGGAGSCKVTPSGAGTASVTALATVDPFVPYVLAAQIGSATTQMYQIQVQWRDSSFNIIRTDSVSNLMVAANAFARVGMLGNVVPNNAASARVTIQATPGSTATAAVFWVDDVLFEEINLFAGDEYGGVPYGSGGYGGVSGYRNLVGDTPYGAGGFGADLWGGTDPPRYFDTNTDPVDAKWEGTVGLSRLHLYPLFGIREGRLADLLTQNIPLGASSRLVWAQGRPS